MTAIIIIVIIALFVAISSFIASTGKVIDKRRKRLKFVTNRGWIIIGLNIGVIILSVLQYNFNERDLKKKDEEAQAKQEKRDSTLKASYDSSLFVLKRKFDTSNIITVSTVSQTLGKYGYMLDSSNKVLSKLIKDSSKVKVISGNDPVFQICSPDGIRVDSSKNGKQYFEVNFCSIDASSTAFNINCTVVLSDLFGNLRYLNTFSPITSSIQIATGYAQTAYFELNNSEKYDALYIFVNGTYKNLDKTKQFNINTIYSYNLKTAFFGSLNGKTRDNIYNFIKQHTNGF